MYKLWTENEISLLEDLYINQGLSLSEIDGYFDRTKEAVSIKIDKLKLRHTKEQTKSIKSRLNSGSKNGMYGKEPWSKGLTKENNKSLLRASKKISKNRLYQSKMGLLPDVSGKNNPMYGKMPWNYGLTIFDDERIKQYGEKISIIKKEYYKNMSDEERKIIAKRMAYIGSRCKKKNTTIEVKIKKFLQEVGIRFEQNFPIDIFSVDFYIKKYNLVIECQGDYWHANPIVYNDKNRKINDIQKKNMDRDNRKIKYLNDNVIYHLFLWESDINRNFDMAKQLILEKCSD